MAFHRGGEHIEQRRLRREVRRLLCYLDVAVAERLERRDKPLGKPLADVIAPMVGLVAFEMPDRTQLAIERRRGQEVGHRRLKIRRLDDDAAADAQPPVPFDQRHEGHHTIEMLEHVVQPDLLNLIIGQINVGEIAQHFGLDVRHHMMARERIVDVDVSFETDPAAAKMQFERRFLCTRNQRDGDVRIAALGTSVDQFWPALDRLQYLAGPLGGIGDVRYPHGRCIENERLPVRIKARRR